MNNIALVNRKSLIIYLKKNNQKVTATEYKDSFKSLLLALYSGVSKYDLYTTLASGIGIPYNHVTSQVFPYTLPITF